MQTPSTETKSGSALCGTARVAAKVIGLVHNPDSDPDMLLDMAQSLLRHIGAAPEKRVERSVRERWLVLVIEGGHSYIETCRKVYAELSIASDFTKILAVSGKGRVEILKG